MLGLKKGCRSFTALDRSKEADGPPKTFTCFRRRIRQISEPLVTVLGYGSPSHPTCCSTSTYEDTIPTVGCSSATLTISARRLGNNHSSAPTTLQYVA